MGFQDVVRLVPVLLLSVRWAGCRAAQPCRWSQSKSEEKRGPQEWRRIPLWDARYSWNSSIHRSSMSQRIRSEVPVSLRALPLPFEVQIEKGTADITATWREPQAEMSNADAHKRQMTEVAHDPRLEIPPQRRKCTAWVESAGRCIGAGFRVGSEHQSATTTSKVSTSISSPFRKIETATM